MPNFLLMYAHLIETFLIIRNSSPIIMRER